MLTEFRHKHYCKQNCAIREGSTNKTSEISKLGRRQGYIFPHMQHQEM